MDRFITKKLVEWKQSKYRKPLILKGARQVGKTYIVKEFAKNNYEGLAYFNFDHDENLKNLFINSKEPKRILEQLAFIYGKAIIPEKTLIFFDEIQECQDALNSLKYFQEEANEYHIIAAGSLLGIRLTNTTFPVGKVEFLNMYPMSFSEFLLADDCKNLATSDNTLFQYILYTAYFIIGGMPEVVSSWVQDKNMELVNKIQEDILTSYENDFSKHTTPSEANKISLIWNNIPSQLSKENKKFLYQTIKNGARAREYENALNWLNNANLISKVYNVSKSAIPLKSYNDLSAFKIYMMDVGLLRQMSKLDSKIIAEGNKLFEEFKGALTENFILNELNLVYNTTPNYFTFEGYEIDFLIQTINKIFPIEVKSGKTNKTTSLSKYNENFNNEYGIRFSTNNLSKDGKILNIPIFMVEYIDKIISNN